VILAGSTGRTRGLKIAEEIDPSGVVAGSYHGLSEAGRFGLKDDNLYGGTSVVRLRA
jgi:hypothetical protein